MQNAFNKSATSFEIENPYILHSLHGMNQQASVYKNVYYIIEIYNMPMYHENAMMPLTQCFDHLGMKVYDSS